MRKVLAAFLSLSLIALPTTAKTHRSASVVRMFKLSHPCPSTGERKGSCPNWIVDHIVALCVGGADAVTNMQWQTVAEAKKKDRWECQGAKRYYYYYKENK